MRAKQKRGYSGRKQLVYSSNIDWYETRERLVKSGVRYLESRKGLLQIYLPFNVVLQISSNGTINVFYDSKRDPRYLWLGTPPRTFKEIVLDIRRVPEKETHSTFTLDDLLKDKLDLFVTKDNKPLNIKLRRQKYFSSGAEDELETSFLELINYQYSLKDRHIDFIDSINILIRCFYDPKFKENVMQILKKYERFVGDHTSIPTYGLAKRLFDEIRNQETLVLPSYFANYEYDVAMVEKSFVEERFYLEATKTGKSCEEILTEVDMSGKSLKYVLEKEKSRYWSTLSERERWLFEEMDKKYWDLRARRPGETMEEREARIDNTATELQALNEELKRSLNSKGSKNDEA